MNANLPSSSTSGETQPGCWSEFSTLLLNFGLVQTTIPGCLRCEVHCKDWHTCLPAPLSSCPLIQMWSRAIIMVKSRIQNKSLPSFLLCPFTHRSALSVMAKPPFHNEGNNEIDPSRARGCVDLSHESIFASVELLIIKLPTFTPHCPMVKPCSNHFG